jgi:predicted nucleic acid-binding protein
VTVVLDTGVVLALYDRADAGHAPVARWIEVLDEDLVTTPLAVAEMEQAVTRRGGEAGRKALRRDLRVGAYSVRWWADGLAETLEVARRHPSLDLIDASLVALAGLLRTSRIATFDEHFRSLTPSRGEPFTVLPADAERT